MELSGLLFNVFMAYLPINSVRNITNASAKLGGLAFDGVTTTAKDIHTIADIGTSDWSVSVTFRCPASAPTANRGLLALCSSATSAVASTSAFYIYIPTGTTTLTFERTGPAATSNFKNIYITSFVTTYAEKIVTVTFTQSAGTVTAYVNGVAQTVSTSGGGSQPAWNDSLTTTYMLVGFLVSSYLWDQPIYSATLFNRALSASEVVTLANQGVQEADKWGSLTAKNTATLASSIVGVGGLSATAFTLSGLGAAGTVAVRPVGVSPGGKKYRATFTVNSLSGGRLGFTDGNGTYFKALDTSTGAQDTGVFTMPIASNQLYFYVDAGVTCDVSGLVVTEVGAILDADLSAGVGYQVLDRSSNNYHGLISTSGTSWTLPRKTGQAIFTASATGYLGDATNRTVIPDGARIDNIQAYSASGSTFSIGDDSTVPTNVIGSTTISAATLTDLGTPAKRFLTTGTDGRLYVTFSAANSTVFTINYSMSQTT